MSPGSPAMPVMVIIIVPELEFDEVELLETTARIAGWPSLLPGSADPAEKAPPKNKKIMKTETKHRNLTTRLNVPPVIQARAPSTPAICFPKKLLSKKHPPPQPNHRRQCPLQSSRSGCLQPYTPTAITINSATIKSGRAQYKPTTAAPSTPTSTLPHTLCSIPAPIQRRNQDGQASGCLPGSPQFSVSLSSARVPDTQPRPARCH